MNAMPQNNYVNVLRKHKILYLPTCTSVEMLMRLYGRVGMVDLTGDVHAMVPDLLILIRQLNQNLKVTADTYMDQRVGFFIGDWKEDRLRSRKIFFNLMSRLGYVSELVDSGERRLIYKAIEEMGNRWAALSRIMERRSAESRFGSSGGICHYFRSMDSKNWARAMANVVLYLNSISHYPDSDTKLILVCHQEVKNKLAEEIDAIEGETGIANHFSPDRIVYIANNDSCASCADCSRQCLASKTRPVTRRGVVTKRYGTSVSPRQPVPAVESNMDIHIEPLFLPVVRSKTTRVASAL